MYINVKWIISWKSVICSMQKVSFQKFAIWKWLWDEGSKINNTRFLLTPGIKEAEADVSSNQLFLGCTELCVSEHDSMYRRSSHQMKLDVSFRGDCVAWDSWVKGMVISHSWRIKFPLKVMTVLLLYIATGGLNVMIFGLEDPSLALSWVEKMK